jgi:hypothetical protein
LDAEEFDTVLLAVGRDAYTHKSEPPPGLGSDVRSPIALP